MKGAADRPVFLLVVKGIAKRSAAHKRRDPASWLVTAVATDDGGWGLPWPGRDLLAWAWQRWEVRGDVPGAENEFRSGRAHAGARAPPSPRSSSPAGSTR